MAIRTLAPLRTPKDGAPGGGVDAASEMRRRLAQALVGVACVAAVAVLLAPTSLLLALLALGLGFAGVVHECGRPLLDSVDRLQDRLTSALEAYDRARLDARVDPLTGLGNHRAFQEELLRQVADAVRESRTLALVMLDLDDLKRLNETSGHAVGDQLLGGVGRLVGATIRASDRAFRIGGDEFALLMPETSSETAFGVVRRLLASATGGHPVLHDTPRFSFSAGIATCPTPSGDAVRLTRHADAALDWAKRHGRTDIQIFDPRRHGAAGDRRSTEELARAISAVAATRALRPVYQPIVSLTTGRAVGFEGLVRPGPTSGFANAESLFAAAEVADRIVELDMAAIETVVANVGRLVPGQYLSVNMSPRTLETDQFHIGELIGVLRRYGLVPQQIVLELTERQAIEDLARLQANLQRARSAGIRIAADDVGAGHAGLRLLSEITFDVVKIDLSLVQKGVLQESSLAVLRALLDMADRWGALVVAEGIETPEQLVALRRLGVTAGQGYLLGRPRDQADALPVDVDALAAMANEEEAAVAS